MLVVVADGREEGGLEERLLVLNGLMLEGGLGVQVEVGVV